MMHKPVDIFLYSLVITGILARLVLPFIYPPTEMLASDSGRWLSYTTGSGFDAPMAFIDAPGYQYWLRMVISITGQNTILISLYAGLLSALTPWFWYKFLAELLPQKRLALLGWGMLCWLPSWMSIFNYFMSETLLLPLLGISLWLSWRAMRKKDTLSFIWAALFWTLAGLTRGIAGPMAAIVCAFIWLSQRHKLTSAVWVSLLVSILLGASGYRYYQGAGVFTPLGQPWLNASYFKSGNAIIEFKLDSENGRSYKYGYKSPSLNSPVLAPFSQWQSARTDLVLVQLNMDQLAEEWQGAEAYIDTLIENKTWLIKENLIFLLFAPSWPDNNPQHFVDVLNSWMRFIWMPLLLVCILWLSQIVIRDRGGRGAPLLAMILVWFLLQGFAPLVVNEGRYRKPIEGVLISAMLFSWSQRKKRVAPNATEHTSIHQLRFNA